MEFINHLHALNACAVSRDCSRSVKGAIDAGGTAMEQLFVAWRVSREAAHIWASVRISHQLIINFCRSTEI